MNAQTRLPMKMRFKHASMQDILLKITSAGRCFFEKNVDFLSLPFTNRTSLLHRTVKQVAGLNCCFIAYAAGLTTTPACYQSLVSIYGSSTLVGGNRAVKRLDSDLVVVKLILSMMMFCQFDCVEFDEKWPTIVVNDMKSIVKIQDQYIELIWQYLLYRYDHDYAVRCFSNLILSLLALSKALVHVVQVKDYHEIIDTIVQDIELIAL